MKLFAGVLLAGSLTFIGCESSPTPVAQARRVEGIPLPAQTPFDADPQLRAVYLDNFARGFRVGATGASATCCVTERPDRLAIAQGFFDGQDAGHKVYSESEEKPSKTPAPTSAAHL